MMSSPNSPLNIEQITQLRDIMGQDFSKLIDTFVTDSTMRIHDLEQALADANSESFRRSAHSFKGSSGNLGAVHLAEMCRQLELMGAEQRLPEARDLMGRLKALYQEAEMAMRSLV